jgi:hypothetical protein
MVFAHVKSYEFKIRVHFWEPKKALHPLPDSVAYIAGSMSFISNAPNNLELEVRTTSIRWSVSPPYAS